MGFCPDGKTKVSQVVKYILLFGTFLHWVLAVASVSVGIWAFTEKNKYFYQPINDVYDFFLNPSIIMMIVGSIMFTINTAGFVGALRENTCLLKFFYICLAIIYLGECIIWILAFALKDKAIGILTDFLQEGYIRKYQDDKNAVIDHFQENYQCCGIADYTDWNMNVYYNCSPSNPSDLLRCAVPYSCCKDPYKIKSGSINSLCGKDSLSASSKTSKIWTRGCVDALIQFATDNLPIVGGVALAIAVPQLMGIELGSMFDSQIQHQWAIYRSSQQHNAHAHEEQMRPHRDQKSIVNHHRSRY